MHGPEERQVNNSHLRQTLQTSHSRIDHKSPRMIQLLAVGIRTLILKPRVVEVKVTIDFNKCDSLKVVTLSKTIKGLRRQTTSKL